MRTCILLLLTLSLLVPPAARADSADLLTRATDLMTRANQAFGQGRFDQAAEDYRELLRQGHRTAAVYYNLGNSYARLGDPGRARAAYEEALRLDPRDPDLRANLEQLEASLTDRVPEADTLDLMSGWFRRSELVALTSLAYWLAAGLLLWRRGRALRWALLSGCALSLIFFGSLLANQRLNEPGPAAVVIPTEAVVYNGPGSDFSEGVRLHAGTVVYRLGRQGDWCEVAALGRIKGWMRVQELEFLTTPR